MIVMNVLHVLLTPGNNNWHNLMNLLIVGKHYYLMAGNSGGEFNLVL